MEQLRKLFLAKEGKGPLPAFTGVQLVYLIMLVGAETFVGRKRLTQLLGIGEGSVRTMLSKLAEWGMIASTRSGVTLTEKGRRLYEALSSALSPLMKVGFEMPWTASENYGVVVKGKADMVASGLEERDEAVRNGAAAAMVLTSLPDGIHMPRISNLSVERPDFAEKVSSFFKPSAGDVIIIAGADEERKAKFSALAAALKLLFGKT